MQMPGDDPGRVWTFVPRNRLNFWLATIQPNKVRDAETRARVIRYQLETTYSVRGVRAGMMPAVSFS